jgi:hypothetical protein
MTDASGMTSRTVFSFKIVDNQGTESEDDGRDSEE